MTKNIIMNAAEESNNLEENYAEKIVCLCKMDQTWKAQREH